MKSSQNALRTFSLLGQLGFVMVFCVLVGGVLGFVIQKHWAPQSPGWTVGGVILGVWAGLRQTYKTLLKTLPELDPEEKKKE